MTGIKEIVVTKKFERNLKSLKDKSFLGRVVTQIEKIKNDPDIGKPLRYVLRGEKTIHVGPYRLIYAVEKDKLILLRFMHRKEVYR